MADSIFGPIVTGADVERAALDTLKLWTPEYLAWVERATGREVGSLPRPRSWVASISIDRWPEEQLPSVLLLSTGLAEEPARDGRGVYRAKFALGLAVVVSARDRRETDDLAKLYTAALRAALLHNQTLGGLAEAVEWVDERYDALPGDRQRRRQLAAGQAVFRVEVHDVVAVKAGPSAPRQDPYPPYPDPPLATDVCSVVRPTPLTVGGTNP